MRQKEVPVLGMQQTSEQAGNVPSKPQEQESWVDTLRWFAGMLLIMLLVRTFLVAPYKVPSGSMIPTLQVGDFVLATKFNYGYSRFSLPFGPNLFNGRIFGAEPHRGDIAVFRYTHDTSIDYVKRIVGLPGDHIQMIDGKLYLNGLEVPRKDLGHYEVVDENGRLLSGERYREELPGSGGRPPVSHDILKLVDDGFANNTSEYVVPAGTFFAMGDDRDDSADSRFQGDGPDDLGFVPMQNLVGRTPIVAFSIDLRHPWWEIWYWPVEIRWGRILHLLH
ncbi:signal peptidase I [Neokomagataea tanensis NBRC 106556]|uniref:Signal peptidase I n=2 Tax=Acetobacteraceae TaxID=433 RepID=A0ABQ0QGB5_9PROT|nr:signal peptidase I [Neokomagataea tanensis NBRC 106556]